MKKFAAIISAALALSASAEYRFSEDFEARDGSSRAYGIEVEPTANFSHGYGQVGENGYTILLYCAKHILATPKLRDFRLETDFSMRMLRQEFDVGMRAYFRWDREAKRGCEVKCYWTDKSLFRCEVNGKSVFERQDRCIPELKGKFILDVHGDRAEVGFLGSEFAFDVPAGLPEKGCVALDTCFAPGTQATLRKVTLVSPEEPKKTHVRDWHVELSTAQGFQEPIRYDVSQDRYASGETEFTAKISGTVMDRGPRIQTGGEEWCSILERLTDPYLRFETAAGEIRNCLFYNGMRTLFDRQLCREEPNGCAANYLPQFQWPIERKWLFRSFPEKFTLAAGYGYAMAHPWRFAENGPYERICDQDGTFLYEGGSLRKGLAAISVLPVADQKVVDRVPQGVPNRDKALKHAATCGYFSETAVPSFMFAIFSREADFAAEELKAAARFESVYGDPLCEAKLEKTVVEPLSGGFRRAGFKVTAAKKPGIGVYHLVVDWNAGAKPATETYVFEVLPDDPNGICPPQAVGLPTLVAMPNEIKYLESSPLDPWADFGGMGHYYTIDERYPSVGLQQNFDKFVPLYRRKWWAMMGRRNGGPKSIYDDDAKELIRRSDVFAGWDTKRNPRGRYDFNNNAFYKDQQLAIVRDYVAEKKPPMKLLTLENLDKHVAENKAFSPAEEKELFDVCWEDFLVYARPRIDANVQAWVDYLLSVNPKLALGAYGPYSVYVSHYKCPYTHRFNGTPVEKDPRVRANGSFFLMEEYHYSCDYPLTRATYFASGYTLHCPNGRHLYPEIYYRGWTRCNDGAVFHAHPAEGAYLADGHQRRIVYQFCYGSPHLRDGKWGYWTDYGFHARNPEKNSMREFICAWGNLLKNKPVKPLKAPYLIQDLEEIARHGDYWEDENNYQIKGFDYLYELPDINNTAEEDLGYTYEQCSASGYNTPVLTTYAELDRLTKENCEFAVLPPVVKGTPANILGKIRTAHARGVNLLAFESVEGLENLFGVKPSESRKVGYAEGESFSHKLAVARYAAGGAEVLMRGAAKSGEPEDIPLLFANRTATGRTAFFAVPPTVVNRAPFREHYTWGQETISRAMGRAERAAFAFLAPSASVHSARGEISAVQTEQGGFAVAINENSPQFGDPEKYPVSFRFTVSAPGIGAMKIGADAPYSVVSREAGRLVIRTETEKDSAIFFTFR